MAVFVLTPVFEEVEDREDLAVWVFLQVPVDGDVTPVADLLGQVGGVEDELRLEEGVLLVGREKSKIELNTEIAHRLVEEAGVARFIAGHVGETLGEERILLLDPTAQLFVEKETGEFGCAALLEELHEHLAGFGIELVGRAIELVVANEVMTVVVLAEFFTDRLQFRLIRSQVHGGHGLEIGRVEPRREDGVLDGLLDGNSALSCLLGHGGGRDHQLRITVSSNVGVTP